MLRKQYRKPAIVKSNKMKKKLCSAVNMRREARRPFDPRQEPLPWRQSSLTKVIMRIRQVSGATIFINRGLANSQGVKVSGMVPSDLKAKQSINSKGTTGLMATMEPSSAMTVGVRGSPEKTCWQVVFAPDNEDVVQTSMAYSCSGQGFKFKTVTDPTKPQTDDKSTPQNLVDPPKTIAMVPKKDHRIGLHVYDKLSYLLSDYVL